MPPPVKGQTANVAVTSGTACYTPPGGSTCLPITEETQIPLGSTVDATRGHVTITTTDGSFVFYDGVFVVTQTGAKSFRTPSAPAATPTVTDIRLVGGKTASCTSKLRTTSSYLATPTKGKKPVRRLFGKGKGNFRTRGSYAAATVRGTFWLTQDYCDGTLVRVYQGVIDVRDFVLKKDVIVRAGHTYFAKKAAPKKPAAPKKKPKPKPKKKNGK